jgi:putative endonuclease
MNPCVYIMTSGRNGTLYVGVTSDLVSRVWQHRSGEIPGFTSRHGLHRLVWFEMHGSMVAAITREKALKKWNRAWKVRLIEENNPHWKDLYDEITSYPAAVVES